MKKFLLAAVLFLLSLSAFGQKWECFFHLGDELKGTKSQMSFWYENEEGDMFVFWDNFGCMSLVTKGCFDCNGFYQLKTNVGFYKDGKLEKKKKVTFRVYANDFEKAYCTKRSVVKQVAEYLTMQGDVRVVAPKFREADFDITAPKFDKDNLVPHINGKALYL